MPTMGTVTDVQTAQAGYVFLLLFSRSFTIICTFSSLLVLYCYLLVVNLMITIIGICIIIYFTTSIIITITITTAMCY